MVPASPAPPVSKLGFTPWRMSPVERAGQRHSPWVTCAILSTASSGMELKVPLPCKERGGC